VRTRCSGLTSRMCTGSQGRTFRNIIANEMENLTPVPASSGVTQFPSAKQRVVATGAARPGSLEAIAYRMPDT
jgi:hypothetical protein